jgi:hypothetical protein
MQKRLIVSAVACLLGAGGAGLAQQWVDIRSNITQPAANNLAISPSPGTISIGSSMISTSPLSLSNGTIVDGNTPTWAVTGSIPGPPQGSFYHQVVDKYFDAQGNQIEVKSATHMVRYDCHSGAHPTPQPEDLVVQDDGHGGVTFAQLLMGNEPTTGQKPITAEDKVKVILAASSNADVTFQLQRQLQVEVASSK